MSETIIIIPARIASTRLPRKALADINGKPMVLRVWECATKAALGKVVVACDSVEVESIIKAAGGAAVMTDPLLASGTDRVKAALDIYDPAGKYDTVVNLQGDMPNVGADAIAASINAMQRSASDIGTAAYKFSGNEDFTKPAYVKIAYSEITGRGLYFSRSVIPYGADQLYCHIGVYCYRRTSLESFMVAPPSSLELSEKLEQLRALENGMTIGVDIINSMPLSIDTPEDLELARKVVHD